MIYLFSLSPKGEWKEVKELEVYRNFGETTKEALKRCEKERFGFWWDRKKSLSWKVWKARAQRTSEVDYHCEFSESGCRRYQTSYDPMKCCRGCRGAIGYLDTIPLGSTEEYLKYWSEEKGFWSPTGCRLPREMRSYTCLMYACHDVGTRVRKYLLTGRLVEIKGLEKK